MVALINIYFFQNYVFNGENGFIYLNKKCQNVIIIEDREKHLIRHSKIPNEN